nr:PREDICTED: uncharacterized protein LOC105670470 isoform X2 [Linepithema humile]
MVFYAATKRMYHHEITVSQRNTSDVTDFVLVNPTQIQHAETVIKHFLTRLTGPITQPIILKSLFLNEGNSQETISKICKIIREKIIEFAQASGLTISVHQDEQTPWNFTSSKDWFTESIVQGSLLLRDLVKVGEEIRFKIDHYFKMYNITLFKDEKLSPRKATKSFKFLNTINKAARFNEELFNCLLSVENRKSLQSFDFIRIFANLTKDSPNKTVKSFKSGLNRAFSYSIPDNGTNDEQLYALFCHSLVERASHYGDCIKELQRLAVCISLSTRDSHVGIIHYTFPPWLSNIGDLSDCKVDVSNNTVNINCNWKFPRTTVQQMKYIYEKILNRRIFKRSSLHRVANDLGNVLSKSTWGRQLTYDVCQCFAIYEEGRRRLNALSKNAAKNKKTAMRCKKLSASLNEYKNGILKEMMLTINNFHRSASVMQKFLTHVMKFSFKESWQNRIRILDYLSEWMTKLLELFGYSNLNDRDVQMPSSTTILPTTYVTYLTTVTPYNNIYVKNNQHLVVHRTKNQMKKETDAAFERLILTMSDVKKIQSRNNNSTLAYLANNMLLIVIFMETLSFVSTLFSFGKYKDDKVNSEAETSTEEWESSERKRRSLFSTDFAAVDTIKNDSLGILKTSKKIINIYNKENINFTRNIPVDITNNFYSSIKGYSNKYKK